ncbi:MAG: NAD(P)H-hydrate dehydratase [Rubricoccaceae bacterium]|nr:NAD(P)H-hydrate dehydratase [Rubricoccaceae bacterium]
MTRPDPLLQPVLTAAAMREADRRTMEDYGLPGRVLMETAGRAACDALEARFGAQHGRDVLVLAGKGNNGGDGLVVARVLRARGARVRVVTLASEDDATEDTAANLALLHRLAEGDDAPQVDAYTDVRQIAAAHPPDLVVDALLGTGVTGALREPVRGLCAWMNRQAAPVVALDVPSGLDADTGEAPDDTVRAALTVAMGALKAGLLLGDGPPHVGEVVVAEIGIPGTLLHALAPAVRATDAWVAARLPRRAHDAHKYSAGRALCVVGSRAFTGAAVLATGAAYRAGAGAVVCCTPESARATVDAWRAEVMVEAQPETDEGTLSITAYDGIAARLANADAVLVGCGLGTTKETQRLVQALVRRLGPAGRPAVLDADGLNAFAGATDKLTDRPDPAPLVLTPHLGEFRRLAGDDVDPTDRLALARDHAARWNAVLLLKGMPTVVGLPDGRVFVGPPGQPGLATAGTGDVLAGTLVGLLARGMDAAEAAVCALHLGAAAAEHLGSTHAAAALVAGDLVQALPRVLRARYGG